MGCNRVDSRQSAHLKVFSYRTIIALCPYGNCRVYDQQVIVITDQIWTLSSNVVTGERAMVLPRCRIVGCRYESACAICIPMYRTCGKKGCPEGGKSSVFVCV